MALTPEHESVDSHEAGPDSIHPHAKPFLWLGKKSVQDRFILLPIIGLVVTILLGFVYPHKHGAPWDFFGSWALIGFCAYVAVVLSAGPLFNLLSRDEDYYGEGHDNG